MNPEEIKRYFERNPPPQGVAWKTWAKITDTQKFLNSCYVTLDSFKGNIETYPAWWHLKEFYQDMLERSRQADAGAGPVATRQLSETGNV